MFSVGDSRRLRKPDIFLPSNASETRRGGPWSALEGRIELRLTMLSARSGGQQESQLVFHIAVTSDGLRDFRAENMTKALPQPVKRDAHGRSAQTEPVCDSSVRCVRAPAGETRAERIEDFCPSGGDVLVTQTGGDTAEQRNRPGAIKSGVGWQIAGRRICEPRCSSPSRRLPN